jgi:serine/threonine protein kinase
MSSPEVFSDRYELVRHIARGGMAQVYLAQDLLLDRPVAIKVLFPELSSDPSFVERFRREAQAAANLSHPNIVSIYDWGQGEHTYFIVMEYIDGQTLSSLIRQGPLPPKRAAAIGADMAEALDFAHRRGVIHRDVKPGNVLIDQAGRVKVGDFGIARAVSNASEGLTQTGAVMGTATYFSPEQAQGQAVDARSDVYSLGVVLYEMTTGRPPFTGDSPVAIAYKHVREQPVPPSQVNPSVPADFEAIVLAAIAKDPDDRYQSAAELRDDLLRFERGQPVLAAHPGSQRGETRAMAGPPPYYSPRRGAYQRGRDQVEPTYQADYGTIAAAEERRSRSGWWASLFLVLLAVLGVLIFFIGRNAGWWATTQATKMPDLKGKALSQAEAVLASKGFHNPSVQHEASLLVPQGDIVSTSPSPGSSLSPGDPVTLDVSTGPPLVTVPNLVKQQCGSADTELSSKGLRYKPVQQNSTTVAQNLVISTSPAAGNKVRQGDVVTVYCSAGPKTTTVPNLQGLNPAQAGFKLSAAHLKPGPVDSVPSSTVKPGLVVYTSPSAGNSERWGSTVTLYVSSGQPTVTVPANLVGESVTQAQKQLAGLGLTIVPVLQPTSDPAQNNIVLSSSPPPGGSIKKGSSVTVHVGQYTPPPTTATTTTATTSPAAATTSPAAATTSPAAATTSPAAATTSPAAATTSPAAATTSPAAATTSPAAATTSPAAATTSPAAATTSPAAATTTSPAATTTAAVTGAQGGGPPGHGHGHGPGGNDP